jgi:acetolactate synthase-1/2/3 large subunit
MKVKISDYITNFLISNNLNTLFTITGRFAIHLNDSFGKNCEFDIYYQYVKCMFYLNYTHFHL